MSRFYRIPIPLKEGIMWVEVPYNITQESWQQALLILETYRDGAILIEKV